MSGTFFLIFLVAVLISVKFLLSVSLSARIPKSSLKLAVLIFTMVAEWPRSDNKANKAVAVAWLSLTKLYIISEAICIFHCYWFPPGWSIDGNKMEILFLNIQRNQKILYNQGSGLGTT